MIDSRWECFTDRTSARRSAAWALHPDLGGDPHEFAAALAVIDRRFGGRRGVAATESMEVHIRRSRWCAARVRVRALRGRYRRSRARLPLARRYFQI